MKIKLQLIVAFGVTNIFIFNFGRHALPQIFTSIPYEIIIRCLFNNTIWNFSEVIYIVGKLLPIMSAYVVSDGFNVIKLEYF